MVDVGFGFSEGWMRVLVSVPNLILRVPSGLDPVNLTRNFVHIARKCFHCVRDGILDCSMQDQ